MSFGGICFFLLFQSLGGEVIISLKYGPTSSTFKLLDSNIEYGTPIIVLISSL